MTEQPFSKFPQSEYLEIIRKTSLVSVDLIIENQKGEILLGYRNNKPAQYSWFVPGGVVRKNESYDAAIARILKGETGLKNKKAHFYALARHLYEDNFAGKAGTGTDYVVLGHKILLDEVDQLYPDDQHAQLRWWKREELEASEEVHLNTKAWFNPLLKNEKSERIVHFSL